MTRHAFAGLATLPLVWSVAAAAGTLTPIAPYRDYATTGVEWLAGINTAGSLTGSVEYVVHSFRPFIRDPSGNYTVFGNTAYIPAVSTYGRGINNNNIVTGYSSTASGNGLEDRGFERCPNETLNRSG